jgi:hypothetical protein
MTARLDVRQRLGWRDRPPPDPPPAPARRTLGPWRSATVLAAAVFAGGLIWSLWPGEPPELPKFTAEAARPLAADPVAPAPLDVAAAQSPAAAKQPNVDTAESAPAEEQLALLPAVNRPLPDERPLWQRNAVPFADTAGRPMIAIVIDDLGLNRRNADRVVRLPGPLTLAFMTYAADVAPQAQAARAAGHELLVHVPMAPENGGLTTGPNALRPELPADELRRRIDWALSRFDGYVGLNNHMGSRFTADASGMSVLLEEVGRRGLLFLDSRTTAATVGGEMARRYGVPFAGRNIFLDNEVSADAVWVQLRKTEAVARRTGAAVAIGHPHDGTIAALARWLPTLEERGFALVPISRIVAHNLAADRTGVTEASLISDTLSEAAIGPR